MLVFNKKVKVVVSDLDDCIAALFMMVALGMIKELNLLLPLFEHLIVISGSGLSGIIGRLSTHLKYPHVISHSHGTEGYLYTPGVGLSKIYSIYDDLTETQKKAWRPVIDSVLEQFNLQIVDPMPYDQFLKRYKGDYHFVMRDDRGVMISFELAPDTGSLRQDIKDFADQSFLSVSASHRTILPGKTSVDFILQGLSKTLAVQKIFKAYGISYENPWDYEVWGDKFSSVGGTDWQMAIPLPAKTRCIDFRKDADVHTYPEELNIVRWSGEGTLHEGLLSYLESRER